MCRVLRVSRSGFYKWLHHVPSKRERDATFLDAEITKIFRDHKERIGSPKMKRELAAKGIHVGKHRIVHSMRRFGLYAKTHMKFRVVTTDSKHDLPIAENLLNREFTVAVPNQVLVTDITYVKTSVGWAYVTVFIDLFSRLVAGWSVSSTLSTGMVLTALQRAIKSRKLTAGVMIHSDRGSQYASELFREELTKHGFIQSMSRKGNCWDNAVAESFFRIYKTEMAYHCDFVDEADVLHKTFEYIECYYNRKRRHGTLNYLTPVEFEKQFRVAA
jgi:putative transposase